MVILKSLWNFNCWFFIKKCIWNWRNALSCQIKFTISLH